MIDLSIIIVSWNAKKYLLECLESVRKETASFRTEVIVVDNASTDGSVEAVKKSFPNVKLIQNNKNLGFAKANNIGISQSAGKYMCLINSDVKILEGCIDRMCVYIDEHPSVGILGPKIFNMDMTLQCSCRKFPSLWRNLCGAFAMESIFPRIYYYLIDKAGKVDVLSGCFWMISRKAITEVGLLDETFFIYAEDLDWCKRFRDVGWEIVYFPDAAAIHYGGASSSNAPVKFYVEMQKANLKYWEKHHSRLSQICFMLIVMLHQALRIIRGTVIYSIKPSGREKMAIKIKRSYSSILWLLKVSNLRNE
ncbi:MAG: glycosyltransferase family 2 protein [Desulfobacterales bacterium]|nr:glycosyltransferase family 2 protein [Desulfobacterales bacterium]